VIDLTVNHRRIHGSMTHSDHLRAPPGDLIPATTGPLAGVASGFLLNRPSYLQWNIALYDDDVFWVLPGSHLHPPSDAEEADLAATAQLTSRFDGGNPSKTNSGPIGDAVPVRLKAGEGVVYLNCILHWGSDYSPKAKRRTLHFGYRAFGNGYWSQIPMPTWGEDILTRLPERLVPRFERFFALLAEEKVLVRQTLLAVGAREKGAFVAALNRLCSNSAVQVMALVLLRGHAAGQGAIHRPIAPLDDVPESVRVRVESGFAAFDRALQHEGGEELMRDGFLNSMGSRGSAYEYYTMPDWTVGDFIASWDAAAAGAAHVARL
jgi:hypothetical protein